MYKQHDCVILLFNTPVLLTLKLIWAFLLSIQLDIHDIWVEELLLWQSGLNYHFCILW